jgi:translation initiation factor 2 beta subunit (eIF-2beta)/eIF-5
MSNCTEPIRGNKEITDPYYRYQMATMSVKKERTRICIQNLDQIAKDLKLPCKDVLVTYIGKKVSAQLKVEKVEKVEQSQSHLQERVTMPGNMDCDSVKQSIYPFIDAFVLCPRCTLPELSYAGNGTKTDVMISCAACGYKGDIKGDKMNQSTLKKFASILLEPNVSEHNVSEPNVSEPNVSEPNVLEEPMVSGKKKNKDKNKNKKKNKDGKPHPDFVNMLDQLMEEDMRERKEMNDFN